MGAALKKILMIATGGTIASRNLGEGLEPAMGSGEILASVPEIGTICSPESLQLMNLDSTNIGPEHWLMMADVVHENYDKYDGFVITHGTDTMAYTAAALSYLIQKSPKPIVLTGSQRSIDANDTDARQNLLQAFLYASDRDSHDVSIVFDGKVILGTRARKVRTQSFNAFSSMDFPEIAVIRGDHIIRYLVPERYAYGDEPVWYRKLEKKILLVTVIPGMDGGFLDRMKDDYEAVVFQSFGVGGLPGGGEGSIARRIGDLISAGKTIVIMTQVSYEGSDMGVYEVGRRIKERYDVLEAHNMTLEAVVTKLMWILGETSDREEIRRLFYTEVRRDIIL